MSGHPVAVAAGRLVSPSRYRHPGDVIRLIAGSILLLVSLVASATARRWLLGVDAPVGGIAYGPASRILTGIVQVACVAAAALVIAATLWHRRFRLLLGLAAAPRSRPGSRRVSCSCSATGIRLRSRTTSRTARGWPARRSRARC
jgi:hypothetical protein